MADQFDYPNKGNIWLTDPQGYFAMLNASIEEQLNAEFESGKDFKDFWKEREPFNSSYENRRREFERRDRQEKEKKQAESQKKQENLLMLENILYDRADERVDSAFTKLQTLKTWEEVQREVQATLGKAGKHGNISKKDEYALKKRFRHADWTRDGHGDKSKKLSKKLMEELQEQGLISNSDSSFMDDDEEDDPLPELKGQTLQIIVKTEPEEPLPGPSRAMMREIASAAEPLPGPSRAIKQELLALEPSPGPSPIVAVKKKGQAKAKVAPLRHVRNTRANAKAVEPEPHDEPSPPAIKAPEPKPIPAKAKTGGKKRGNAKPPARKAAPKKARLEPTPSSPDLSPAVAVNTQASETQRSMTSAEPLPEPSRAIKQEVLPLEPSPGPSPIVAVGKKGQAKAKAAPVRRVRKTRANAKAAEPHDEPSPPAIKAPEPKPTPAKGKTGGKKRGNAKPPARKAAPKKQEVLALEPSPDPSPIVAVGKKGQAKAKVAPVRRVRNKRANNAKAADAEPHDESSPSAVKAPEPKPIPAKAKTGGKKRGNAKPPARKAAPKKPRQEPILSFPDISLAVVVNAQASSETQRYPKKRAGTAAVTPEPRPVKAKKVSRSLQDVAKAPRLTRSTAPKDSAQSRPGPMVWPSPEKRRGRGRAAAAKSASEPLPTAAASSSKAFRPASKRVEVEEAKASSEPLLVEPKKKKAAPNKPRHGKRSRRRLSPDIVEYN